MAFFLTDRFRALAFLSVLLGVAGCSTPSFEFMTTLDDGQKVHSMMVNGLPELVETGDVKIDLAAYMIEPSTTGVIGKFGVTVKHDFRPAGILIEDVTNTPFIPWVDDKAPVFSATGQWTGQTASQRGDSKHFEWLSTVSNSMRIFRFTFIKSDGRKVVIHQAAFYPGYYKAGMRKAAGLAEPK